MMVSFSSHWQVSSPFSVAGKDTLITNSSPYSTNIVCAGPTLVLVCLRRLGVEAGESRELKVLKEDLEVFMCRSSRSYLEISV